LPDPPQSTGEIIEIIYTGGTTKAPKGIAITDNLFIKQSLSGLYIYEPLFPPETNIIATNAPLFHILGQNSGLSGLFVGSTTIIHPQVNLDIIFDAIQRYKVKTNVGVPALYRRMLEHPRLEQYDLSSVQVWLSGGDVLPVELGTRWREKFGRSIIQAYGATETCGGVTICPLGEESPPKSVGKVLIFKKVLLVDPVSLKPVKVGEPGELLVHSEHMVESYLNKPDETEKSFVDLNGKKWYRTNDIMTMDENGHFYFVDRTVDMIKHKGYRVSSSEIESILQEHPAVIGSIVVGVDDANVGQRIKAFVVLKEDIKGITAYDLIKWCRERMASYKVPQYIEFRDVLPKSKAGKFLKRDLRTEEEQRRTVLHKAAIE
jgi:long-chain acyl-CoA synthetase